MRPRTTAFLTMRFDRRDLTRAEGTARRLGSGEGRAVTAASLNLQTRIDSHG